MERESSSSSLSEAPSLVHVLEEHRSLIAQRVMAGVSGAETLASMTEFVDGLILGRYRDALRQGGEERATVGMRQCCLMALGGYGRRELAPQSDIDLMFLFEPGADKAVESLVRAVLHPLWDCGFQVGHSVRTIGDSIELAETDATVPIAGTNFSSKWARCMASSVPVVRGPDKIWRNARLTSGVRYASADT